MNFYYECRDLMFSEILGSITVNIRILIKPACDIVLSKHLLDDQQYCMITTIKYILNFDFEIDLTLDSTSSKNDFPPSL